MYVLLLAFINYLLEILILVFVTIFTGNGKILVAKWIVFIEPVTYLFDNSRKPNQVKSRLKIYSLY